MSMSKKDYIAVAETLAETHVLLLGQIGPMTDSAMNVVAASLAKKFQTMNSSFDANRFLGHYQTEFAKRKRAAGLGDAKKVSKR